jgi:hypothetical protein
MFITMAARKNEIVRESYYRFMLCCFVFCEIKKIVTNSKNLMNSYIWQSECPNYQITTHWSFFYFQVGWGWFVGDSTWLIHYKKQTATQLYCQIPSNLCSSCIYLILVILLLFSVKIFGVGGGERGSDNTFFFKNNLPLFYYHTNN